MEIYTSGLIIMRGMRQASNRAAKTAISFQCWVQESERGTSASWIASISTGDSRMKMLFFHVSSGFTVTQFETTCTNFLLSL